METATLLTRPTVRNILFVGGKPFNRPLLDESIHVTQWEQDVNEKKLETPHPVPDMVIVLIKFCSHSLSGKAKDFAKTWAIPWVFVDGGKAQIIERFAQKGLDVSHLFGKKKTKMEKMEMPEEEQKQKPGHLAGDFGWWVLKKSEELGLRKHPLSNADAAQIKNLVQIEWGKEIETKSIKRLMRLYYDKDPSWKGFESTKKRYERGEIGADQKSKKTSAKKIETISSPKAEISIPEPEIETQSKPQSNIVNNSENISFENNMPAIFKKIFDVWEKYLETDREKNEYFNEVERLSKENKELRIKLERMEKIESLIKQINAV